MFAINTDWTEYMSKGYENEGRNAIVRACKHTAQNGDTNMEYSGTCDECGFTEDSAEPMMNYRYPLKQKPSDDKILEVVKRTCCTVMYNVDDDAYSLALCSGGMNLSQDIALAYVILEKWIPFDLAVSVCSQKDLSVEGEDWTVLKKAVVESLQNYKRANGGALKKWAGQG